MQVERRDSDRGSLSWKRSGGELERRPSSLSRDRGFESVFLQWGVSCEPDFSKSGRRKFHRAKRSGAASKADHLAGELEAGLAASRRRAAQFARRPRVYFEEWDEPMISGIAWVSELIETAGGTDIFADRAGGKSAKERIVTAEEIIAREPDIIIGSWCGKKFRAEKVAVRPGFERIPDRRVSLIAAPPPGQPVTLTAPAALRPRDFWRRAQSSRRCTGCCHPHTAKEIGYEIADRDVEQPFFRVQRRSYPNPASTAGCIIRAVPSVETGFTLAGDRIKSPYWFAIG